MGQNKSLFDIIKWKLAGSIVIGAALWIAAAALGFPPVFQGMFVFYVVLGFIVFVMLDLPPMREITGKGAIFAIAVFYGLVSVVYVTASHLLPQYDPNWEKEKIAKILERKRDRFTSTTIHDLYSQTQTLMEKADAILVKLNALEAGATIDIDIEEIMAKRRKPGVELTPEEMIAYGREVYDLYECYNCHKIGGKGSTKKRGPELDNIGNLLSAEDLKKKILDPTTFYAEGFEEEHKEGLMPDDYGEIMDDLEVDALAAYLATLKNPRVNTPKPILHEHAKH